MEMSWELIDSTLAHIIDKDKLVGGFNPLEKYARQNGFIFPKVRGENKKYLSCHHLVNNGTRSYQLESGEQLSRFLRPIPLRIHGMMKGMFTDP